MIDEHELCERTFDFAVDVSKLCVRLQERGPVVRRLSMKLLDAGTSIGANIEEGRAGQTKPDFIAKNFISLKESRETRFWLRVIAPQTLHSKTNCGRYFRRPTSSSPC